MVNGSIKNHLIKNFNVNNAIRYKILSMCYDLKVKSPSTCPSRTWSKADGYWYNQRKVAGPPPIYQVKEGESLEVQGILGHTVTWRWDWSKWDSVSTATTTKKYFQAWWLMHIYNPSTQISKQESHKFRASLVYRGPERYKRVPSLFLSLCVVSGCHEMSNLFHHTFQTMMFSSPQT